MPRPKANIYRKYFTFDPANKFNQCSIVENDKACNKIIKNDHGSNLSSHIKSSHKSTWSKIKDQIKKQQNTIRKPSPMKNSNRTILGMLNPTINIHMSKDILLKSCVELCTINGRPFAFVEDSGFRKIIDPIIKGIGDLTINRKTAKDGVLDKYKETCTAISKEMEGKLISLKIDGLTHLNRAFLGVNAQFISNGQIILRTFSVAELYERHTGEYLRDVVVKTLKNYNISPDQVYSCTTDNGRNMLKCISLINEYEDDSNEDIYDEPVSEFDNTLENFSFNTRCVGVRCAAHTLQLAINAVLKDREMEMVISTARNVVKKLRTPNINILLKNQGLKKPIIDCATRWSSTFEMLSSINDDKMKEFCLNLAQANQDFFICEEMWSKIGDAVEALRPANVATKILQKEQLTFGDAYDAWFTCKMGLTKIKSNFSLKLLEQIKSKEDVLFENDAFIAALFLDPRWNVVLSSTSVERAINHIVKVSNKIDSIAQDECMSVEDDSTISDSSDSSDCVEAILKSMEKEKEYVGPNNTKIRNLLNNFRKEKRIPRSVNILHWWEGQKLNKPELYDISKVILAVPATQVSVERLFSGVKFIMNPSRNRLDDDSLNAVVVIRSNKDLF